MSRTSLSMSYGNQSTKYAVNARTRISSFLSFSLVLWSFCATWTVQRGLDGASAPRATPRARAGHFRRVSENSGKVRALRRKHLARTVSPNRAVFAVHLRLVFHAPTDMQSGAMGDSALDLSRGARRRARPNLLFSAESERLCRLRVDLRAGGARFPPNPRVSRGSLLALSRHPLTNHERHIKFAFVVRSLFGEFRATDPSLFSHLCHDRRSTAADAARSPRT